MATTYSGSLAFQLSGLLRKSLDIGNATLDVGYSNSHKITNGTGGDQANMIWTDTRTVAASDDEDLDLYGSLTNAFGDTINFTTIKGIFIFASSLNTNNAIISGTAAILNGSDVITLKPGGMLCIYDPSAGGYAVTDSSSDLINVENSSSGTGIDYDVIIVGEV